MNPSAVKPAVTIVIPVWDAPYVEWLPDAVAAVRRQDPATPIVVVDNASTIPVPSLEGTTVVRAPRRLHKGEARNHGLEVVKTEFVMFLDADDELLPGALDTMRREIASDPGLAAFCMSLLEAGTGRRHRFPHRFAFALARFPRVFALANTVWSLYSTQACAILRTAWVRDCGGYSRPAPGSREEKFDYPDEDGALGASQAFRGRIGLDRRPGLVYRIHDRPPAEASRGRSLMHAGRRVRERLRSDPAVPAWARAMIPVIAALQALVIYGARPIYRVGRAAAAKRPARTAGCDWPNS